MRLVTPDTLPRPAGHYSPAVVSGGFVFVSGQLPVDPETGRAMADASIEAQVACVMANVAAILAAAGSSLDRIVRVSAYVSDVAHWPAFNAAYAVAMGDHRPARTVVPVPALHHGVAVEVDVIAEVGPESGTGSGV